MVFDTKNSACLLWKTEMPNYQFVAAFNDLFETHLSRQEDIEIFGTNTFPIFIYFNEVSQLYYFLIDNIDHKIDPVLKDFDFVMIINGRDAFEKQIALYNDFYNQQSIFGFEDYLSKVHHTNLTEFKQHIARLHYFNYQGPAEKIIQLHKKKRSSAKANSTSLTGKIDNLNDCFTDLLREIERYYYSLEDDENQ